MGFITVRTSHNWELAPYGRRPGSGPAKWPAKRGPRLALSSGSSGSRKGEDGSHKSCSVAFFRDRGRLRRRLGSSGSTFSAASSRSPRPTSPGPSSAGSAAGPTRRGGPAAGLALHPICASTSPGFIASFVSDYDRCLRPAAGFLTSARQRASAEAAVALRDRADVVFANLRQLCCIPCLRPPAPMNPRTAGRRGGSESDCCHSAPTPPTIPDYRPSSSWHSTWTSIHRARNALLVMAMVTTNERLRRRALLSLAEALDAGPLGDDRENEVPQLFDMIDKICGWLPRVVGGKHPSFAQPAARDADATAESPSAASNLCGPPDDLPLPPAPGVPPQERIPGDDLRKCDSITPASTDSVDLASNPRNEPGSPDGDKHLEGVTEGVALSQIRAGLLRRGGHSPSDSASATTSEIPLAARGGYAEDKALTRNLDSGVLQNPGDPNTLPSPRGLLGDESDRSIKVAHVAHVDQRVSQPVTKHDDAAFLAEATDQASEQATEQLDVSQSKELARNNLQGDVPRRDNTGYEILRVLDALLSRLEHYHDSGCLVNRGSNDAKIDLQQAANKLTILARLIGDFGRMFSGMVEIHEIIAVFGCLERIKWMLFTVPEPPQLKSVSLAYSALCSVVEMAPPRNLAGLGRVFADMLFDLLDDGDPGSGTPPPQAAEHGTTLDNTSNSDTAGATRVYAGKKIIRALAAAGALHPHGTRCFLDVVERLAWGTGVYGRRWKRLLGDVPAECTPPAKAMKAPWEWLHLGVTMLSSVAVRGRTAAIRNAALKGVPRTAVQGNRALDVFNSDGWIRVDDHSVASNGQLPVSRGSWGGAVSLPDQVPGLAHYVSYRDSSYWKSELFGPTGRDGSAAEANQSDNTGDAGAAECAGASICRAAAADIAQHGSGNAWRIRSSSASCLLELSRVATGDGMKPTLVELVSRRTAEEADRRVGEVLRNGCAELGLAQSARPRRSSSPSAASGAAGGPPASERLAGGRYGSSVQDLLSSMSTAERLSHRERSAREYAAFVERTGLAGADDRAVGTAARYEDSRGMRAADAVSAIREARRRRRSLAGSAVGAYWTPDGAAVPGQRARAFPAPAGRPSRLSTGPYHHNYRFDQPADAYPAPAPRGGFFSANAPSAQLPHHSSLLGTATAVKEPRPKEEERQGPSWDGVPKAAAKDRLTKKRACPVVHRRAGTPNLSMPQKGTANRRKLYSGAPHVQRKAAPEDVQHGQSARSKPRSRDERKVRTPPEPVVVHLPQARRERASSSHRGAAQGNGQVVSGPTGTL